MPASRSHRLLLSLFLILGLVATACGGGATERQELTSSALQPDSATEPIPWNVEPSVAPMPDAPTEVEKSAHEPGATVPVTEVLALAFAAPEELSYSFTQGVTMTMDMPGLGGMSISPAEPIAHGEVSGTRNHISMDMGVLMEAIFDDLGGGSSGFGSEFDGAVMEMWSDEETLVMDLSSFYASMGALDPTGAGELALFADGPIMIDLSQIPGLSGSEFASQYAQGTQVVDPALLLQSLRSVDALRSVGPVSMDGRSVEAYDASITMAQYYEALGIDPTAQMDLLGGMGVSAEEEALVGAVFTAMDSVPVEMRILVDEEQLIRRLEVVIDMQPLMAAMFSDDAFLTTMAEAEGVSVDEIRSGLSIVTEMEFTVGTWQEFDNYGGTFDIDFPEAVDMTAQFSQLVGVQS